MVEDPSSDFVVGDESGNFHVGTASVADQRVDFVDSVNELSPSFVRGTSNGRGSRFDFALLFAGNGLSVDSPHTIGVGTIKMDEMLVGLWDMNENSSQEL